MEREAAAAKLATSALLKAPEQGGDVLQRITASATARLLAVMVAIASGVTVSVLGVYFWAFSRQGWGDNESFGQFGDFVGGTLNPILAFMSFIALVFTVILQTRQLEISREELHLTRIELEKSANAQQESANALKAQMDLAVRTARDQHKLVQQQTSATRAVKAQAQYAGVSARVTALSSAIATVEAQINQLHIEAPAGLKKQEQLDALKKNRSRLRVALFKATESIVDAKGDLIAPVDDVLSDADGEYSQG